MTNTPSTTEMPTNGVSSSPDDPTVVDAPDAPGAGAPGAYSPGGSGPESRSMATPIIIGGAALAVVLVIRRRRKKKRSRAERAREAARASSLATVDRAKDVVAAYRPQAEQLAEHLAGKAKATSRDAAKAARPHVEHFAEVAGTKAHEVAEAAKPHVEHFAEVAKPHVDHARGRLAEAIAP